MGQQTDHGASTAASSRPSDFRASSGPCATGQYSVRSPDPSCHVPEVLNWVEVLRAVTWPILYEGYHAVIKPLSDRFGSVSRSTVLLKHTGTCELERIWQMFTKQLQKNQVVSTPLLGPVNFVHTGKGELGRVDAWGPCKQLSVVLERIQAPGGMTLVPASQSAQRRGGCDSASQDGRPVNDSERHAVKLASVTNVSVLCYLSQIFLLFCAIHTPPSGSQMRSSVTSGAYSPSCQQTRGPFMRASTLAGSRKTSHLTRTT
ncbi:hypothetical protein GWK47_002984 [Chionoecetes opilio]|uniref:Uncharacterized protein n=1 Tax=Chionoecetes opilio TaxID=41210 RepID=A0A8J8WAP1_CHIOP|nr:hypothetical protein GWK47_002984 [Chionoecetes opilio]